MTAVHMLMLLHKSPTTTELSRCRQFYNVYSSILGLLTQELKNERNSLLNLSPHKLENLPMPIFGTVSQESKNEENQFLGCHPKNSNILIMCNIHLITKNSFLAASYTR